VGDRNPDPGDHPALRLSRDLTPRPELRARWRCSRATTNEENSIMDKERIAGGVEKATGTVKKAIGKATGNRRLENEGRAEKAEGRVRSAVGHAKDAVREIVGKR
jgi:uncharacterized protein YjbJ (UPF0337 family)